MLDPRNASTLTQTRATIARMSIGKRMLEARKRLKLRQAEVAKLAGVTRSAVSQLENELTHNPRPEHLLKFARALGMTTDELITGVAPRAPTPAAAKPPQAAEPAAAYKVLTEHEQGLLDYIRRTGRSEAGRDRLAQQALHVLVALIATPVDDERLGPRWSARGREEKS